MEVDCLHHFLLRTEPPCPLSRFRSRSALRTRNGDSALALNLQCTHPAQIRNDKPAYRRRSADYENLGAACGDCSIISISSVRLVRRSKLGPTDCFVLGEGLKRQPQVPIRLRSGQAFDSAEVRFAQDDKLFYCGEFGDGSLATKARTRRECCTADLERQARG